MLNENQLQHFETFGFVVLRDLFTTDEVETLRQKYEAELDLVYADKPFTGEERYWTMMFHPRRPLFYSLLEDERFSAVAQQMYGDDVIGIGCDANHYVGDTGWHPDHAADPEEDVFGVKFAFYLDPVDATTGALRLIPGSHNRPFHYALRSSLESLELEVPGVPAHVCASEPGDVVAFDMRCWHASHGGATGRRMRTCVYYNNPKGEVEEASARTRAERTRSMPDHFGRPGNEMYPREWLANEGGSVQRQRRLERMAAPGYFERPSAA